MKKNKKIIVGMSGGVDSSVALMLLKRQGYQPIGVSLKYASWQDKRNKLKENICCSLESFAIAREICQKMGVSYNIIDEQIDFREKVMGYFLDALKEKKTPNPCIICNKLVKFNKLFDFAKKQGARYIATGHYAKARGNKETGLYELLRAKDKNKDQSYFLCLLSQKQLKDIIFPLGDYTKEEVYKIVEKEGFDFFTKIKQSQNLCFVASQSIPFYLEDEIGIEPGKIVGQEGNILGEHKGLHFYTIGQRRGLDLPGGPWWVVGFDKKNNQLIVTNKEDDPALFRKELVISGAHFISGRAPDKAVDIKAKTRFNQELALAKLYPPEEGKLKLIFNQPQKAVTPGQWAVFYLKDICLGGGVIESAL